MVSSQPVEYTLYTGNFHMNFHIHMNEAAVDILAINCVNTVISRQLEYFGHLDINVDVTF